MPPAGASSSGRSWQAEKSSTIDPDLFPKAGEDPEADLLMNWTQVNGIWMKYPGGPPGEKKSVEQDRAEQPFATDPGLSPMADEDLDFFEPEGEDSLSRHEKSTRKRCSSKNT